MREPVCDTNYARVACRVARRRGRSQIRVAKRERERVSAGVPLTHLLASARPTLLRMAFGVFLSLPRSPPPPLSLKHTRTLPQHELKYDGLLDTFRPKFEKTIITLQELRIKLNRLNQTCKSLKLTMQLTQTIFLIRLPSLRETG